MPYRHGYVDTSLPDGMRSYVVSDRSDSAHHRLHEDGRGDRMPQLLRLSTGGTLLRHLPQYAGLTNTRVGHAGERAEHNWTGAIRFNRRGPPCRASGSTRATFSSTSNGCETWRPRHPNLSRPLRSVGC